MPRARHPLSAASVSSERENAALLNAALSSWADHGHELHRNQSQRSGISVQLYLTQGSAVMAAEVATARPVKASRRVPPTRCAGAAFLSGLHRRDGDLCRRHFDGYRQLRRGFPREANSVVEVGGVRTFYRMPDLLSMELEGGTVIAALPRDLARKVLEQAR